MIVYAVLFALIIGLWISNLIIKKRWILCDQNSRRYKFVSSDIYKFFVDDAFILIVILILISSFRDFSVGTDLENYKLYYDSFMISPKSFKTPIFNYEFGFKCFTFLFAVCKIPFRIYLMIIALLFWISVWFFAKNVSKDKIFTILIFCSVGLVEQSFSALRQILALSFIFYAVRFLIKQKWYLYILLVLIAFLFHKSAIIFIPLIAMNYIDLNWKSLLTYAMLVIVGTFLFNPLMSLFEDLVNINYFESYSSIASTNIINWVVLLITIIGLIVIIYIFKTGNLNSCERKENRFFIWLFSLIIAVKLISFVNVIENMQRLLIYFYFSLGIILPNLIDVVKEKFKLGENKFLCLKLMLMIVFYLYAFYNLYFKDLCGVVPFIFNV